MMHNVVKTSITDGVMVMVILVATLLGLLAGGVVCLYYLRSTVTGDIGPQLKRMHADIDPQLRRMQNQLDNIESAVNLALASRYAELSQLSWTPPAIPAPRAGDPSQPQP
jgi:hypothetical protein